jgi:hypothetical protein
MPLNSSDKLPSRKRRKRSNGSEETCLTAENREEEGSVGPLWDSASNKIDPARMSHPSLMELRVEEEEESLKVSMSIFHISKPRGRGANMCLDPGSGPFSLTLI